MELELESSKVMKESSKVMKEFVTDIWELNKKRSYMTIDICLEIMETIQSLRDLCSNHQEATKNYEKTLRIIKKLIKQMVMIRAQLTSHPT